MQCWSLLAFGLADECVVAVARVWVRDGGDGAEGDAPPVATFVRSCFQCFTKGHGDLSDWVTIKRRYGPRSSRSLFGSPRF